MFARFGRHVRQQYAGFLALFIALGSVSYAAVALPKNSVGSKQIKNGRVKNSDLATNAVTTAKVRNGSLLATDFKAGQLAASGPAGPQGAQGPAGPQGAQGPAGPQGAHGPTGPQGAQGPTGPQGAQGLKGDKGDPGTNGTNGTNGADATKLWAVINADGSFARGSGVFQSALLANGGTYEVAFNRNVRDCAFLATIGSPEEDTVFPGMISAVRRSTNQNSVLVKTYSSTGADVNMPFHLGVFC